MTPPVHRLLICIVALVLFNPYGSLALEFVLLSQYDFSLYRIQTPPKLPVRIGQIPIQTDIVELQSVSRNVIYTFDRSTNQIVALDLRTANVMSITPLDQNIQTGRRGFAISQAGVLYGVLPGMQLRTIDPSFGNNYSDCTDHRRRSR